MRRAPPPWPGRPGRRSSATARPRGSSPTSAWARAGRCAARAGPGAASPCGRCTPRATRRTTCAGSSRSTPCCSRVTTSCTARPSSSARPTATSTSTWPACARLRDADPPIRTLAPGHGRLMDHVPDVVDALVAHRLGRHERVAVGARAARRGDRRRAAARGLRRRHRAPAAGGPLLAVGAPARPRPGGQGPLLDAPEGADVIESRWAAA